MRVAGLQLVQHFQDGLRLGGMVLARAIESGIGPAKAYGFGLLSIARVR